MKASIIVMLLLLSIIAVSCSSGVSSQPTAPSSGLPLPTSNAKTASPTPASAAKSTAPTASTSKDAKNLGKAKDWYEMALKEAQKWQNDAKFMELHAYNTSVSLRVESIDKITIAGLKEASMNGIAETWEYYFISKKADVPYQVVVTQGNISKSKVAAMFLPRKYETMKEYADWLVDSPEAIEIAKSKVTDDITNGAFITYALFNGENNKIIGMKVEYINRFIWQISIQPYKKGVTVVQVDGTTKEILETDMLK
jgi:hypothetical protein